MKTRVIMERNTAGTKKKVSTRPAGGGQLQEEMGELSNYDTLRLQSIHYT